MSHHESTTFGCVRQARPDRGSRSAMTGSPATMPETGNVERPNGRAVAWATWGDPGGRALLLLHGTPGSRLSRSPDPDLYGRLHALVATFDRPGYGGSSAQRDRTILSVAEDAVAVADALGWTRFGVLGVSGGGPHALALAVRAPERVAALGLAVGAAPPDLVDPDDLIAINREGLRRAREEGRESLEAFLAGPAAQAASDPGAMLDAAMEDAPPVDREMLARPDVRRMLVESLTEAFVNGPVGWFDDSWALSNPWGFELGEVPVPVRMWYGEADRNVPLKAVQKMAEQLKVDSLEIIPGAGHLGWLTHEERVLGTLLDRAR
jgi:pimeloyl-ACP methyl ester carboxylesterase